MSNSMNYYTMSFDGLYVGFGKQLLHLLNISESLIEIALKFHIGLKIVN